MLHDPNDRQLFPKLTPEDVESCVAVGQIFSFEDGEIVFRAGVDEYCLNVVLSGHLQIFIYEGDEESLVAVHGPGEFSGEMSMLAGNQTPKATAKASGNTKVARICREKLRQLIGENARTADVLLTAMAKRSQQIAFMRNQDEKLAALGKMSAGLAHELNNPAAAAQRSASMLLEAVFDIPARLSQVDGRFTQEQREYIRQFGATMREKVNVPNALDPLEQSDREQEFLDWLEEHHFPRADEIACTLASTSLGTEDLENWRGKLGEAFVRALFWAETVTRLSELARDIESSVGRISELVSAMKEYTYMDQAKFQVVDVHAGLESTLKVMHHKLKHGVEVRREYDKTLPAICAYAGELNQVWTNLIDNAIDAMNGKGILTIRTMLEEDRLVVDICDTGAGIPAENLCRIFEPFFTTKPVGKGTGLGLDISYKIITNRHGGEVRVRSKPGETCFQVLLPQTPPREHEMLQVAQEARL